MGLRHRALPVGRKTKPLANATREDLPRAKTMPPRLAHLLTGIVQERRPYTPKERARLISERRYPPYAPMYALLQGRSIKALALQSGLGQDTLQAILKGRREPWFFSGIRIARALGISPEVLDRYLDKVQRNPLE